MGPAAIRIDILDDLGRLRIMVLDEGNEPGRRTDTTPFYVFNGIHD
jgi:hypothetical protein